MIEIGKCNPATGVPGSCPISKHAHLKHKLGSRDPGIVPSLHIPIERAKCAIEFTPTHKSTENGEGNKAVVTEWVGLVGCGPGREPGGRSAGLVAAP